MPQNSKVAIVTGTSAGIGQASAKALHQAGFRVFGTSRRPLASVSAGIAMITCDVTDDARGSSELDCAFALDSTIGSKIEGIKLP